MIKVEYVEDCEEESIETKDIARINMNSMNGIV